MSVTDHGQRIVSAIGAIKAASGAKQNLAALIEITNRWVREFEDGVETLELFKDLLCWVYDGDHLLGVSPATAVKHKSKYTLPDPAAAKPFGKWVMGVFDSIANCSGPGSREDKLALVDSLMTEAYALGYESLIVAVIAKDLRCALGASTVNKAFPNLLPVFEVMLAKPFDGGKVKSWPVAVEPKLDGMRVIAHVRGTTVRFCSRNGKEISSLDVMKPAVLSLAAALMRGQSSIYIDGEVMGETFLQSISEVKRKSVQVKDAHFHVFDFMPGNFLTMSDDQLLATTGPYSQRRKELAEAFGGLTADREATKWLRFVPCYFASGPDEVQAYYNSFRTAGYEGAIVKDIAAGYQRKRSASWGKIKAQETLDLEIVGAFEGLGQFEDQLGGFIVNHEGVNVNVGGGYSNDQRKSFWGVIQDDLKLIAAGKPADCAIIGALAEVSFQEVMPSGSLRHPNFIRLRLDKSTAGGMRF